MVFKTILRKILSFKIKLKLKINTANVYFWSNFNSNIEIGRSCEFHSNVFISQIGKGKITIGNNCSFGDNVKVISENATISIGDNVYIGPFSIINCQQEIIISDNTQIAEHVTIRDQDHKISAIPLIESGFIKTPISIGKNVWIGCKSSVLRGSNIGDNTVIGAHSLVKSKLPENVIAFGVPAKPITMNNFSDK